MEKLMLALATGVSLTWDGFVHQLRQVWFLISILAVSVMFFNRSYDKLSAYPKQVDINTTRITRDSTEIAYIKSEMSRFRMSHDSLATAVADVADISWKLYCYEVGKDGTTTQMLDCNLHSIRKSVYARPK